MRTSRRSEILTPTEGWFEGSWEPTQIYASRLRWTPPILHGRAFSMIRYPKRLHAGIHRRTRGWGCIATHRCGRATASLVRVGQVVGDVAHIWPQQVDDFKDVDFSRGTDSDLEMLRTVPEEAVKHWFAEIIGQSEVPKDWGGEQYDLWTRLLSIDGTPMRAAIAFKGPAAFRPDADLHLGIEFYENQRLAESPADLLVVQHCHTITSRVEHMLRTYATSPAHVRKVQGDDVTRRPPS